MLEFMKVHGPFVGAIGFSCGAAVAVLLASLLEGTYKRGASWGSETVSFPFLSSFLSFFPLSHNAVTKS